MVYHYHTLEPLARRISTELVEFSVAARNRFACGAACHCKKEGTDCSVPSSAEGHLAPVAAWSGSGMPDQNYSSFQVIGTVTVVAPPGGGGTEPVRLGRASASRSSEVEPDGEISSARSTAPEAET